MTETDEEKTEISLFDKKISVEEMVAKIQKQIHTFFEDKEMHFGGPITRNKLNEVYYVCLLIDIDLLKAIKIAYTLMGIETEHLDEDSDEDLEITEDIQMVLNVLHDGASKGVDKEFLGGILLMHLELCEGHSIREFYELE